MSKGANFASVQPSIKPPFKILRLRVLDPFSRVVECSGGTYSVTFLNLTATNESGSPQALHEPLSLTVSSTGPSVSQPGKGPPSSCPLLARTDAVIATNGVCSSLTVSLRFPSGLSPAQAQKPFRLILSSSTPALLIPASVPRSERGGGKKWVPTIANVPVVSIITPVFYFTAKELEAEGGSMDTTASSFILCLPSPSPFLAHDIRLFEQHNAVTPGFGSILWDAAVILAGRLRVLHQGREKGGKGPLLKWMKAIDIGSGTGFVGICAAALGASVVLTDLPILTPLAAQNALLNGDSVKSSGGALSVIPLEWGKPLPPGIKGVSFDLILASEVAFSHDLFSPLIASLTELLDAGSPRCKIVLGARQRSGIDLSVFLGELSKAFDMEEVLLNGEDERGFIAVASGMSKTSFVPQLYTLTRKNVLK